MAELKVDLSNPEGFTYIKARPEQISAGKFQPHELIKLPHGYTMRADERTIVEDKGGHLLIEFRLTVIPKSGPRSGEKITWTKGYIYGSHWKGISKAFQSKAIESSRFSAAGSSIVLQPTPLFNQYENKDWADDGSASNLRYGAVQCGLTSAAMLVATIWPNGKVKALADEAGGQFEDWIAGQFKRMGRKSTLMEDHVAVLQALGIKARATRSGTIGELKQALHKHPVILGMAYKVSGHFTCGVGVADRPGALPDRWPVGKIDALVAHPRSTVLPGVLHNCPFGDRDFSGSGNNWFNISRKSTDTFGLHGVLSNSTLERFWVDGGEESGWAVFVDPATPNAGNRAEKPVELAAPASKTITQADIDRVAKMLGCESRALRAVMQVEAGGGGFLADGRPKILFEAHYFSDFTNNEYDQSHPDISSRKWNRDLYIGGAGEWGRFDKAAKLDRRYAICSCSWGLGQVMGSHVIENPEFMDYYGSDVERFYKEMCASEGGQLTAMGLFIKSTPEALEGIRSKDWESFARSYNGEGFRDNAYDVKLADAYASLG
jgi:hypothetical protein